MQYGISFLEVDNSKIETAYKNKATRDYISYLKQVVAYEAVYGFEYEEVSFEELGNILSNDYGFNPFKYKTIEEGATYNKEKHPNAWGRIRGRDNISGKINWVCLDVDDTTITIEEMHHILFEVNHHMAITSNPDNKMKYRIILPLTEAIEVTANEWKHFVKSIANFIGVTVDNLGASQVFYGYKGREVYSTIGKASISPSTHLEIARMKVAEIEEKRACELPPREANKALQNPFNTFNYAYEADDGKGTNMMLGAIAQAKELGASREYIIDLLHSINNFWDVSMPEHTLKATVMTAI